RGADEQVAIDQHGLAIAPVLVTLEGHHVAAEVLDEVLAPDLFALVLDVDADEVAVAAEGVKAVAIDGRRATRAVAPTTVAEERADLGPPELRLRLQIDGEDVFGVFESAQRVERVADDRRPGEAEPRVLVRPEQLRAFLRPRLQQAFLLGDIGAVGPAELRPIVRANVHTKGK